MRGTFILAINVIAILYCFYLGAMEACVSASFCAVSPAQHWFLSVTLLLNGLRWTLEAIEGKT